MTDIGDIVLIYVDNNPAFFARIEEISADLKRDWFQVKLLVLKVPLVTITWILREEYYNGQEFTMGGRPMRLEKVTAPDQEATEFDLEDTEKVPAKPELVAPQKQKEGKPGNHGKVISISDRRKKDPE